MARFSFRPLFRRLSSIRSTNGDSSHSGDDSSTDTTAATSATPSPGVPIASGLRKTSSVARHHTKLRGHAPDTAGKVQEDTDSYFTETLSKQRSAGTDDTGRKTNTLPSLAPSAPQRSDSLAASQHWQELNNNGQGETQAEAKAKTNADCPALILQQASPEIDEFELQRPHDTSRGGPTSSLLVRHTDADADADAASQISSHIAPDEIPDARHTQSTRAASVKGAASILSATSVPHDQSFDNPSDLPVMVQRKIWVKRPSASATLVQIRHDDLVDDVREMILRKYANSLGRTFDAPDMTLNVVNRDGPHKARALGPEEEMCRVLDAMYPGGQTVDEALVIEIPIKRTPKPSPRHFGHHGYHALDDYRPHENGTDYFPPMPLASTVQPFLPPAAARQEAREHHHSIAQADHPRSISVLSTGQIPPLPSPGAGRRHRERDHNRPKYTRQHTSSPVILSHPAAGTVGINASLPPTAQIALRSGPGRPHLESSASEHPNGVPPAPPLPTPPAPEAPPTNKNNSTPPTPNGSVAASSHLHRSSRPRRSRKSTPDKPSKGRTMQPSADQYGGSGTQSAISSMLDAFVPPINVLIVEDNIINLRILEGLMKRLKVRWQTAMNGQIAVDKYKAGGRHLVLMDIQMPMMNGLQATKEIRRLERVNSIGIFSSSAPNSPAENGDDSQGRADEVLDKLTMSEGLFKSPVIIVALTASSLQSDRHEALAAGCNDFLTKPVDFMWLERKVKEWGCMQALIDFDGWRKWKDYAVKEEAGKSAEQRAKEKEKEAKERARMEKMAKPAELAKKKAARKSVDNAGTSTSDSTT